MAGSSSALHEDPEKIGEDTVDLHRAIVSIMEEFEAVDWYDQRIAATGDEALAAILTHNRDEEKEHASMTLEWLRRRDPVLDRHLRRYLFRVEPITEIEPGAGPEPAAGTGLGARGSDEGSLRIGCLRERAG